MIDIILSYQIIKTVSKILHERQKDTPVFRFSFLSFCITKRTPYRLLLLHFVVNQKQKPPGNPVGRFT